VLPCGSVGVYFAEVRLTPVIDLQLFFVVDR
jgi:hypothetical protein